jgi:hypothetical protein
MKEKYPYAENPLFELLGTNVYDHGPLVVSEYYFRGWIPKSEFQNGLCPIYVMGHTGKETLVRTEGVKPAVIVKVTYRQTKK